MNDLINKIYRDLAFGTFGYHPEDLRNQDLTEKAKPTWEWTSYNNIEKVKAPYPYNLVNNGNGITIEVAAIGLAIEDIDIELEGSVLRVKHTKAEDETDYIYKKITNKSFELAWTLSNSLNLDTLNATLDKGLLSIKIDLKESATLKKIKIK